MATKTTLLDVGGTFIKSSDGRSVHTNSAGSREEIAEALRNAVGPLDGVSGVGVAIPGPFNYTDGTFFMKHKFASVFGERFSDLVLPSDCQMPPVFRYAHDVAITLEGAIRMLGLQGKNVALITLGTGLGFCRAINGIVKCNPIGSPDISLWNLPTPDGGILEDKVSSRGIRAEYARRTGRTDLSPLQIAKLAAAGDQHSREAFALLGKILGENIAGILDKMGIEILLMGGQVSKSLDLILPTLQKEIPGVQIQADPDEAVFAGLSTLFETF